MSTIETTPKLNIQSHKNYLYSPTMRASVGSFLKIKPDGTVSYHNPNCLKYAAPGSKPFRPPALNARNDGSVKTFERLKASIDKAAAKDSYKNMKRYIGVPCIPGWYIAATDGHRALLARGDGTGERSSVFDKVQQTARLLCSITNPEFHLALKRALIMTPENSDKVRLVATPGVLTLSSAHEAPGYEKNDAGDFEETIAVNCAESWHVAIDGKYLELACGSWPMAVWYTDAVSPIMFEPSDSSWRYIVMPMADDWTRVDLTAVKSVAVEEIPEPIAVEARTESVQHDNHAVELIAF